MTVRAVAALMPVGEESVTICILQLNAIQIGGRVQRVHLKLPPKRAADGMGRFDRSLESRQN